MERSVRKKPVIGIAFGGGGARGFAHIGVIQALEEAKIEVDVLTGTSIGSLAGAAWASGKINELAELARNISLTDLPFLLSPAWSVSGMFSGKSVFERVASIIGSRLIEELPKKFAAVASDLKSGEAVIFREGSLIEAIRASSSIPGIFTPVRSHDRVLVDGALFSPVPVRLARSLGAEVVIAVDLFGGGAMDRNWPVAEKNAVKTALQYLQTLPGFIKKEKTTTEIVTVFEVLERSLEVSQAHLTELELNHEQPAIVLRPNTKGVSVLDFHRGAPLIAEGYRVAKAALPELLTLI